MYTFKSIFLIDDDPDDQYFFTLALGQLESYVLFGVAFNGKDALEQLAQCDSLPDLIVLDMNMPLMNGLQCLAGLKQNSHTQYIPTLILSDDERKMELAIRTGANACLKKPIIVEKLGMQLDLLAKQCIQ